jgi:LemA protein
MRGLACIGAAIIACGASGCGYNQLSEQDEDVKAAWSQVVIYHQRRADLVPTLVAKVNGLAAADKPQLADVTAARERVDTVPLTPELINSPGGFRKFEESQASLAAALDGVVSGMKQDPGIARDATMRDLMQQLEGTEKLIDLARTRYVNAVRAYNGTVREFPTSFTAGLFGFESRQNFTPPK